MDILDILLDILLKPPQPFIGLFFTYQLILVYLWIVFILTSMYDIEIIHCPKKVTGRVFVVYPYNSTNE